MLLSRDEMTLDFDGARLDPVRDREILGWAMNQFLYGEVTGIQVGHWLYAAPDLESARFLAKQAIEELQHVGNFLKIMQLLSLTPGEPHPALKFLATGMMGDDWAEHVAMEMATGEGFVLMALYAVIDTLDHPEVVAILERAVRQEEGHVAFGEQQTMKLIEADPALRRRLLGLSLIWMWGVGRLASYMQKRLPAHPVLARLPRFLELSLSCSELRLRRMGLLDRPLADLGATHKAALIAEAYARKGGETLWSVVRAPLRPLTGGKPRLTDTYLSDPSVRAVLDAARQAG
jgi:bacterioferritin (cytochrome b1)